MIDALLRLGESLWNARDKLKATTDGKRVRVSEFLEEIAVILLQTVSALRRGEVPHGNCERLRVLATAFEQVTRKMLGDDEAKRLAELLMASHEIEKLAGELQAATEKEREQRLMLLETAAGRFSATALVVRTK